MYLFIYLFLQEELLKHTGNENSVHYQISLRVLEPKPFVMDYCEWDVISLFPWLKRKKQMTSLIQH